jgi:nucleotide-binding universal stress UspA family protein
MPGSVGERLLAAGPSAVAVAPRGFASRAEPRLRTLGVAWTAGHESDRALALAAELAGRVGAELRLLSVVEPVSQAILESPGTAAAWSTLARSFEQAEAQESGEREQQLAAIEGKLRPGVDVGAEVLHGDPVERLIERSAHLDLLLLGSRAYGPLKRVLLGSVSSPLLRQAECPVIVVPRADP